MGTPRRAGLDEVPAHAVARGADAVPGELPVVLLGQQVMAGGGDQVVPAAVGAVVGGALEAAQEEAPEQAGPEGGINRVRRSGRGKGRRQRRCPCRGGRPGQQPTAGDAVQRRVVMPIGIGLLGGAAWLHRHNGGAPCALRA